MLIGLSVPDDIDKGLVHARFLEEQGRLEINEPAMDGDMQTGPPFYFSDGRYDIIPRESPLFVATTAD